MFAEVLCYCVLVCSGWELEGDPCRLWQQGPEPPGQVQRGVREGGTRILLWTVLYFNVSVVTSSSLFLFVLFRTQMCECTPVQVLLPWLLPPRCDGLEIRPMAALQMNKSTYSQLLLTFKTWRLICSFVVVFIIWWC